MKNKVLMLSLMVIFAITFVFTSCEEVQDVKLVPDKAAQVKEVKVEKVSPSYGASNGDNDFFLVTWTAPKDSTSFQVYLRESGKNTIREFNYGFNDKKWDAAKKEWVVNTDIDAFSATIYVKYWDEVWDEDLNDFVYIAVDYLPAKFQVGVRTEDIGQITYGSDIKWSAEVTK